MTVSGSRARVGLYGVGAIGTSVARALIASDDLQIVAAIDRDPRKVGRDLRSILRLRGESGVTVSDDVEGALDMGLDVVIHATGSRLETVAGQIETILAARIPCVSSCEEMAFPEASSPSIARRLDRIARVNGVGLLGAGVNPGFVMDALVLALSGATRDVTQISVERILDPLSRRKVFRKKVGLGMTHEEARRKIQAGRMGHVGLRESALLIARGLGWRLTRIDEHLDVLCEDEPPKRRARRPPNPQSPVRGLHQTLTAREENSVRIHMEMIMEAGVEGPHDAIAISGLPDIKLWIQGGLPGDEATVSCLLNGARQLLRPPHPGLLTVLDLPLCPSGGKP